MSGCTRAMTSSNFKKPSYSEILVRRKCAELERRCRFLENDSTGAQLIAALDGEKDKLVCKVAALEKENKALKAKKGNLASNNKEFKDIARAQKKQIASLTLDVKYAHSLWHELTAKLKKCEEKRFQWAHCARRLGKELSALKAEMRSLKARLNRNPENSSLPPSQDPNHKKVYNSRVKTERKPGGQVGHRGHVRHKMTPDEVVVIPTPDSCPFCGGVLKVHTPTHRQVTELIITTKTTDYVASKCVGTADV